MEDRTLTILIVEDGDEYLDNLSRFVPGPRYIQAHSGAEAVASLRDEQISLVYMDMRFDRIPKADLLGDFDRALKQHNGDAGNAWTHLQNNQGLFILDAMRHAGFGGMPIILAYDFSREDRRFAFLKRAYPKLGWVPDAVTPDEIRDLMVELVA